MIPTPPTLAGLFFCLTSAEGARLLFCPAIIQPHTSVYKGLYSVYATIPPTPQNSTQGFTSAFPAVCTILQPQIPDRKNGSMSDSAADRRPCQPGGVSILPTLSGWRSSTGSARHPPPGGAIQQQGRGGRRGTIGGLRRSSFRASAR